MIEDLPVPVGQPEWERGLWWMVLASGIVHLALVALVVLIPHTFLHRPPALKSYTVDLIAPDRLGGNNVIAGGKGRVEGAPMAEAPKAEPPKPAPRVEEPKPPQPKPEPQKLEPPPEPVKEAAKPQPKPEPPKAEPQPEEHEVALAEKKAAPPPAPTVAKPVPSPPAKPAAQPKAAAKAEPAKPPAAESKAAAESAKKAKEATASRERDERIAAAIKHVEQQMGKRGAGSGAKVAEQPGGPISVGPGEGAGGTVKGVEYLLYYNQMINRIKQVWAWAGANRALEASVRFNIADNGEVVNVRITRSSGDASYDASVGRAVRAANPLPSPPEAYRKEFSDVELVFRPDDLKM